MQVVAVLGVLECEQRAVGRERSEVVAAVVGAAERDRLGAAPDLLRRLAVGRDEDREPVRVADAGGDEPWRLREPLVPAQRDAWQEGIGVAARERLGVPLAGLAAGLVLPVQDASSVERERARDHADRMVGDLAAIPLARSPTWTW